MLLLEKCFMKIGHFGAHHSSGRARQLHTTYLCPVHFLTFIPFSQQLTQSQGEPEVTKL